MFLLDRALVGGLKFVFGKIAQVAEQEADEEPLLRDRLLEAQMQLEQGALDDAEYEEIEADVLARLRRIKEDRLAAAKAAREDAAGDDPASAPNHEGTDGRQTITVEAVELGFEEPEEGAAPEGLAAKRAPSGRKPAGARTERAGGGPKRGSGDARPKRGSGDARPKRGSGDARPKRGPRG